MKKTMTFVLLIILTLNFKFSEQYKLNPKKVVYAVDCGSVSSYKSSHGFTYQAVKTFLKNYILKNYYNIQRMQNIVQEKQLIIVMILKNLGQPLNIQEINKFILLKDIVMILLIMKFL